MLIYRVENKNGRGMYRNNPHEDLYCSYRCPSPFDETMELDLRRFLKKQGEYSQYYYGFSSKGQARAWFPEDVLNSDLLDDLAHSRMWMTTYDVSEEHLFEGNQQTVFLRGKAVRVDHTTVRKWFKAYEKSLEADFL